MVVVQSDPTVVVPDASETFARFTVQRALGTRKVTASLAHGSSAAGVERLVLESYSPSLGLSPQQLNDLATVAKRLMSLRHPNLGLVRDVGKHGDNLLVASEYTEGITFEELRRLSLAKGPVPLEIGLRIVVDVLSGLSALHTMQSEMPLGHGEVSALNVLVGHDGITRLLRPYRGNIADIVVETDSFGYVAPEVLKGKHADPASDIFGAGVLLWEVLARRKLFGKSTREAMATRVVKIPKPVAPADAPWASPLANVAERALSLDPAQRYATAAEMAAAVRLIIRSRLAMPPKVADLVDRVAGDAFAARRARDATPEEATSRADRKVRPSIPPHAVKVLEAMRPSSRPMMPTPAHAFINEAPTVPRAPPLGSLASQAAQDFDDAEPISIGGLLEEDFVKAPLPPPTPARPSNRPVAPPLDLTPPPAQVALPPPPRMPSPQFGASKSPQNQATPSEPIQRPSEAREADALAVPVIAQTAPPIIEAPPVFAEEPPLPDHERRNRFVPILLGVGALCMLLIAIAGIRFLLKPREQIEATQPTATATTRVAPPPVDTTSATTEPTTALTAPTPSVVVEVPSASADPSATSLGLPPTPTGSTKRTPKPRPTYDPEGI